MAHKSSRAAGMNNCRECADRIAAIERRVEELTALVDRPEDNTG